MTTIFRRHKSTGSVYVRSESGEWMELKTGCKCHSKSPTQDTNMSTEQKPAETTLAKDSSSPAVPSRERQDTEIRIPQGPQAGDVQWPDRHMPNEVRDEPLPGVDDFDVLNPTYDDLAWSIATGGQTGAQRNPAQPLPTVVGAGTEGEVTTPTPTDGSANPKPQDPGFNPGPQKSVANGNEVTTMDYDTDGAHDTDENVNTDVHMAHLKAVAASIAHSGKEGCAYLHPMKGAVHHVAHPDDLHPDNAHLYHDSAEIARHYAAVKGVKSVKVGIQSHPKKGSGYTMFHKGMIPKQTAAAISLRQIRASLVRAAKAGVSQAAAEELGKLYDMAGAMLKFPGVAQGDATGKYPPANASNPGNVNYFSGLMAPNGSNAENTNEFNNIPEANQLDQSSLSVPGSNQSNTMAVNPPTRSHLAKDPSDPSMRVSVADPNILESVYSDPIRTDPGTNTLGGADAPNIPESVAFTGMTEKDVLDFLDAATTKAGAEEAEDFETWLTEACVLEELEA